MAVTADQAHMLASLAVAARPHGAPHWDAPGVVAAIGNVKHLALADVMAAVARGAADRTLNTPAPIGIPSSSCWKERVAERAAPAREPFDPSAFCGICSQPEARCTRNPFAEHEFIRADQFRAGNGAPRPAELTTTIPARGAETEESADA